jgi:hypothetical protein
MIDAIFFFLVLVVLYRDENINVCICARKISEAIDHELSYYLSRDSKIGNRHRMKNKMLMFFSCKDGNQYEHKQYYLEIHFDTIKKSFKSTY